MITVEKTNHQLANKQKNQKCTQGEPLFPDAILERARQRTQIALLHEEQCSMWNPRIGEPLANQEGFV